MYLRCCSGGNNGKNNSVTWREQKIRELNDKGAEGTKGREDTAKPTNTKKCYLCGETGHIARECEKGLTCYNCGGRNHLARDCRKRPPTDNQRPETPPAKKQQVEFNLTAKQPTKGDCVMLELDPDFFGEAFSNELFQRKVSTTPALIGGKVNGHDVSVLIDTGATVSLISKRIMHDAKIQHTLEPWTEGPIRTANGQPLEIIGIATVNLVVGQANITYKAIAVETLARGVILGKNILELVGATLNLDNRTITFKGCDPVCFESMCHETMEVEHVVCEMDVVLAQGVKIPARSEAIVAVTVEGGARISDKYLGVIKERQEVDGRQKIYVANTVVELGGEKAHCMVVNPTEKDVVVIKGE